MKRFNYVKQMSIEELSEYIVREAMTIELARKGISSVGVDPDRWDLWVEVEKKKLMEEMK